MTQDSDLQIPTVLVVEDEPDLLQSRLRQFAFLGVRAIGSESAESAAAYLLASNDKVSLAIIDVNLRPDDPGDQSGIALARLLRGSNDDVLLVGYSAKFEPGELADDDRSVFSAYIEKARLRPDEIAARYADFARDVMSAEHSATVDADGDSKQLAVFLDETHTSADPRVIESRAFLRSVVKAYGYDGLRRRGRYSPVGGPRQNGRPALPDEVASEIFIQEPGGAD